MKNPVTCKEQQEQYERDFEKALSEVTWDTGLFVRTRFTETGWSGCPAVGWPGDLGAYNVYAVLPAYGERLMDCAKVQAVYRSDEPAHPAQGEYIVSTELSGPSHRNGRLAAQLVISAVLDHQVVRDHFARRSPVTEALDELATRMRENGGGLTLGNIEAISARIRQGDDMDAAWQAVMDEEDG